MRGVSEPLHKVSFAAKNLQIASGNAATVGGELDDLAAVGGAHGHAHGHEDTRMQAMGSSRGWANAPDEVVLGIEPLPVAPSTAPWQGTAPPAAVNRCRSAGVQSGSSYLQSPLARTAAPHTVGLPVIPHLHSQLVRRRRTCSSLRVEAIAGTMNTAARRSSQMSRSSSSTMGVGGVEAEVDASLDEGSSIKASATSTATDQPEPAPHRLRKSLDETPSQGQARPEGPPNPTPAAISSASLLHSALERGAFGRKANVPDDAHAAVVSSSPSAAAVAAAPGMVTGDERCSGGSSSTRSSQLPPQRHLRGSSSTRSSSSSSVQVCEVLHRSGSSSAAGNHEQELEPSACGSGRLITLRESGAGMRGSGDGLDQPPKRHLSAYWTLQSVSFKTHDRSSDTCSSTRPSPTNRNITPAQSSKVESNELGLPAADASAVEQRLSGLPPPTCPVVGVDVDQMPSMAKALTSGEGEEEAAAAASNQLHGDSPHSSSSSVAFAVPPALLESGSPRGLQRAAARAAAGDASHTPPAPPAPAPAATAAESESGACALQQLLAHAQDVASALGTCALSDVGSVLAQRRSRRLLTSTSVPSGEGDGPLDTPSSGLSSQGMRGAPHHTQHAKHAAPASAAASACTEPTPGVGAGTESRSVELVDFVAQASGPANAMNISSSGSGSGLLGGGPGSNGRSISTAGTRRLGVAGAAAAAALSGSVAAVGTGHAWAAPGAPEIGPRKPRPRSSPRQTEEHGRYNHSAYEGPGAGRGGGTDTNLQHPSQAQQQSAYEELPTSGSCTTFFMVDDEPISNSTTASYTLTDAHLQSSRTSPPDLPVAILTAAHASNTSTSTSIPPNSPTSSHGHVSPPASSTDGASLLTERHSSLASDKDGAPHPQLPGMDAAALGPAAPAISAPPLATTTLCSGVRFVSPPAHAHPVPEGSMAASLASGQIAAAANADGMGGAHSVWPWLQLPLPSAASLLGPAHAGSEGVHPGPTTPNLSPSPLGPTSQGSAALAASHARFVSTATAASSSARLATFGSIINASSSQALGSVALEHLDGDSHSGCASTSMALLMMGSLVPTSDALTGMQPHTGSTPVLEGSALQCDAPRLMHEVCGLQPAACTALGCTANAPPVALRIQGQQHEVSGGSAALSPCSLSCQATGLGSGSSMGAAGGEGAHEPAAGLLLLRAMPSPTHVVSQRLLLSSVTEQQQEGEGGGSADCAPAVAATRATAHASAAPSGHGDVACTADIGAQAAGASGAEKAPGGALFGSVPAEALAVDAGVSDTADDGRLMRQHPHHQDQQQLQQLSRGSQEQGSFAHVLRALFACTRGEGSDSGRHEGAQQQGSGLTSPQEEGSRSHHSKSAQEVVHPELSFSSTIRKLCGNEVVISQYGQKQGNKQASK